MILLGCDPEYILTRKGIPFSSIGLIGGSKAIPLDVNEGALQEDNVLAEINITPSVNVNTWNKRIVGVTRQLREILPRNVVISKLTTARYPEEQLIHPLAREFGCDPDINAWNGRTNPPPNPPEFNFRSAGGHVHIGREKMGIDEALDLVRCLDTIVGLQSLFLDPNHERRKLYDAGRMRKKPYGVEWRTLSNFWVFSAYDRRWIWRVVRWTILNKKDVSKYASQEVESIINNNRQRDAVLYIKSLWRKFRLELHRGVYDAVD